MFFRALLLLLLSVTERSCPQQLSRVEERDIMQIILGRQGRYSVQFVSVSLDNLPSHWLEF